MSVSRTASVTVIVKVAVPFPTIVQVSCPVAAVTATLLPVATQFKLDSDQVYGAVPPVAVNTAMAVQLVPIALASGEVVVIVSGSAAAAITIDKFRAVVWLPVVTCTVKL